MNVHRINILLFLLLAHFGNCGAQNLFSNSGFDSDISGWTSTFVGCNLAGSWDSEDVVGSPGSGSLTVSAAVTYTACAVSPCINLPEQSAYDLTYIYKTLRVGPGFFATVDVRVRWNLATGCSGEWVNSSFGTIIFLQQTVSDWSTFTTRIGASGAMSAQLIVTAHGGGLSQASQLKLDNVQFAVSATQPVTLQSFTVD